MDFEFTEDQTAIRDLVRGILEGELTPERLKRIEAEPDWFDRKLWATLAESGVLGIAVPAAHGGMGLGVLELAVLLEEIGRTVAPLPILPTLVFAGLPIAAFGTDTQRETWLPGIAAGETILTAALVDAGSDDPVMPGTTARADGDGWVLDGEKRFVPAVHLASRVLVPARTPDGVAIFLLDPTASGVAQTRFVSTTGEPVFTLKLDGARVEGDQVLGGDVRNADAQVSWLYERALAATCATQVGVSEKALEVTTSYVRDRVQFGVPIGSFQAVQHRSADAYIDLASMRWLAWRAAWKLATGEPAARDVAVAKYWAAEGGSRIANTAQHLHGGIGVDLDYPIHRYFVWSKALEISLGAATPQLVRLGRSIAQSGPNTLS